MAVCKITAGYGATTPCPPPSSGIYEDYGYLYNWEDGTVGTPSSAGVVSTFAMTGATLLYKVKFHRAGAGYTSTLADNDDGGSEWTHRGFGRIVDISSTAYTFIAGAPGAKVGMILRTKAGHFKMLGVDGGLYLKESEESSEEGKIGHTFAFVGDKQPHPPYTLVITDLAATLTALEAELV